MFARQASTLLVAALTAGSAWAQGYLGLALGQTKYRNACQGAAAGITCDTSDTALRLFGGWDIRPNLAIELGANFLGTVGASTGESADLTAFDLSALGSWPIGNRFAVHGRLGIYQGDFSARGDTSVPVTTAPPPPPPPPPRVGWSSGSSAGLTYGLGTSYDMTDKAGLRVDWQRFNDFGGGGPHLDIDVYSIGVLMRF